MLLAKGRIVALVLVAAMLMSITGAVSAQTGGYVKTFDLPTKPTTDGAYAGVDPSGATVVFWHPHPQGPRLTAVTAAADAFRRELAIDPNDFDSNLQLGGLLRQEDQFAEARTRLAKALQIRPGDFGTRYQLAAMDLSEGHVEEARQGLESIVKETPEFIEAHVSLATVYYRLKRKQDGDRERELVRKLNAAVQAAQPSRSTEAVKP